MVGWGVVPSDVVVGGTVGAIVPSVVVVGGDVVVVDVVVVDVVDVVVSPPSVVCVMTHSFETQAGLL